MVSALPVISVNNLGKKYSAPRGEGKDKWALRNVTFKVNQGEVLGIIGRNGAGKSTLLKLLSRVTQATEGDFRIEGSIYSLLELGMGFHDELTGIDNLYVAGAIQGMTRSQIKSNLDEIIDFSGIGEAVFQPLRTYSSGMKVRLAFALAAFATPDILILDEILAVGDENFQRKCFETIRRFLKQGVTVLFVTHDMKLISLICSRCILIDEGEMLHIGSPEQTIDQYTRIMGPRLMNGPLTLTRAGKYMQLFYDGFRITRSFGLYTSVRKNRVWYDPGYILWDQETLAGTTFTLTGHYVTVPVSIKWQFQLISPTRISWMVSICPLVPTHLDRFQVNVMISPKFTNWRAGSKTGIFPELFSWAISEDWDVQQICPPSEQISMTMSQEKNNKTISLACHQECGALQIVNSNPEFQSRVLQYLKTWNTDTVLAVQEICLFDGVIELR